MEAPQLDVRYVAQLARLSLSDDEVSQFQEQLAHVVEYVAQLDALDLSAVEPTAHAEEVRNMMRPDEPAPGLDSRQALANAPASSSGMFSTVRVVE